MVDDRTTSTTGDAPEPPPFQPDPDLIAYLEHSGKPTEAEVRKIADRVRARSAPAPDD